MTGYDLRGFARFFVKLRREDGKPMVLEPFERTILRGHFGGVLEVVVLLPKKNYKTTLMAALGLFHLAQVSDAECVIGASSRDQAAILFRQASGLLRRSGEHAGGKRYVLDGVTYEIREGYREIWANGGRMRVLAADAATADGVIPTLALVDELHRHPSGDLYGVFRDGLEARGGRMITISTAGYSSDSPLGVLRTKAYAMASFRRKGVYNHASSGDGAFEFHEWCLSDQDDLSNMTLVKRVNPARHHSRTSLKRRYDSPSMTPARWARFACGIFPENAEPWILPTDWDALGVQVGGVHDGEDVYVAVRVGAGAGVAIVAPRDEDRVAVALEMIDAPASGRVAFAAIEQAIRRACERYRVLEVAYDPDQFRPSAERLAEEGLPMDEIPQRTTRLSRATATLWRLISAGLLIHDGNPVLRAQVLAGRTKETTQGWHLEPTSHTTGLIAVAVACEEATKVAPMPPEVIAL